MYQPEAYDIFAGNGAEAAPTGGVGSLTSSSAEAPGMGIMDYLKLGRSGLSALKLVSPSTYADATSWLPTTNEITSSLGLDGVLGQGSFLGGAASAFGPALGAYGLANLLAGWQQSLPRRTSYGGGIGSLQDGYQGLPASQGLYDQWTGDRDWYAGGDPSGVDLVVDRGSMSNKKSIPYYSIGGALYQTPELATNSGRQIARGMMGLPVPYEDLPNAFDPVSGAQQLAPYQRDSSMSVYDAPRELPGEWDDMMDRQNRMGGSGEGQTSLDVGLDAFKAGLDPRQLGFFNAGLNTSQLYRHTGPQMADDPISLEDSQAGVAKRLGDAIGVDNAQPLDVFSYGFGPGRNLVGSIRQPGAYP